MFADGGTGVYSKYVATKRADLDRLAEELSALNSEEREQVLRAASQWGPSGRRLSWEDLRALKGIVELGGNAVEDCDRLYDV